LQLDANRLHLELLQLRGWVHSLYKLQFPCRVL
jgi:hypothetical protein